MMNDTIEKLQKELAATQRALAESEERRILQETETCRQIEEAHKEWLAALDVVGDPIFMYDKNFRILRCNRAYQKLAGLPFNQIIGRPYFEIFPKNLAPLQVLEQSYTDGDEKEIQVGETFFRSRFYPLKDKNGQYLHSVHLLEDITEHMQTKQVLNDSEEKFRSITTSAQDAILMMDDEGKISYWNEAAEKMFGYTMQEAIGQSLHDLLTPERFLAAHYIGFSHFQKTGEGPAVGKTLELAALKKDGTEFPIELSLSAVKISGRLNAIGIIRDISERKKSQELLRQSEEKFRSLVESSIDWIWEVDQNGRYTYASPRVETLLQYTPEEVLGKSPFDFMLPDESQRLSEGFTKMLIQQAPIRTLENTNVCKDGTIKILETSGVPFYDQNGAFAGYRGIDRDITERKQSEISIKRANRALKTLSAGNMALVRAKNESELLQNVTDIIVKQAGYNLAVVVYADENTQKSLTPVAAAGMKADNHNWANDVTWDDTPNGQLPVSLAIRSGVTQVCRNIACSIGLQFWKDTALSQGYVSNIALPLTNGKKTFGALCIYSSEENAFDEEEIKLLEELASDLAYGIINLRARVLHEQHVTLLRESLEQSIQTIAATVEARDPYTAGHQNRVSELAIAIAQEMNLSEEQIHGIQLAAIIHDLGKIHIPAEILSKPGRLNNIEFMLIQTHPQEGYNILKDVKFPWPIADIILQHHEKIDGSGYPQGLKDEEILIEAKIICVADVVEAMSSHRPYRASLGIEPALDEIRRGRGIWYDTTVVDACLKLFEEKKFFFSLDR
ncbi:PAS domain S-box protein [Sulfuricurvum sp.]|uniref:PAS domain S-box protein n=1 Tax=Sulfuricurvum sp. TaxID=2025608 RepID=UPI002604A769|nr:PAS domain S-box protein [Sulfuricurvum sp.]MDD2784344.1 PAS domain S-box protein [Sulfuricurvum sp.]